MAWRCLVQQKSNMLGARGILSTLFGSPSYLFSHKSCDRNPQSNTATLTSGPRLEPREGIHLRVVLGRVIVRLAVIAKIEWLNGAFVACEVLPTPLRSPEVPHIFRSAIWEKKLSFLVLCAYESVLSISTLLLSAYPLLQSICSTLRLNLASVELVSACKETAPSAVSFPAKSPTYKCWPSLFGPHSGGSPSFVSCKFTLW